MHDMKNKRMNENLVSIYPQQWLRDLVERYATKQRRSVSQMWILLALEALRNDPTVQQHEMERMQKNGDKRKEREE
jgi:hypothetical protein